MTDWSANFEANPEDTDSANNGANEIRALKVMIRERGDLEHQWANSGNGTHRPGIAGVCYVGNTAQIANLANMAVGGLAWDTTLLCFKVREANAWTRRDVIPANTAMLFVQAAAPTGWTLDANNNDKLIRVANANGGNSGGNWTPTLANSQYTGNMTYTTWVVGNGSFAVSVMTGNAGNAALSNAELLAGSNHTHAWSNDWRPAYIDAIICTKD